VLSTNLSAESMLAETRSETEWLTKRISKNSTYCLGTPDFLFESRTVLVLIPETPYPDGRL
jgi:hypothetical protein